MVTFRVLLMDMVMFLFALMPRLQAYSVGLTGVRLTRIEFTGRGISTLVMTAGSRLSAMVNVLCC